MDSLLQILIEQGIGIAIGALLMLATAIGVPFLRKSAKAKLIDKDPSNDFLAHVQEGLADVLDKKKDALVESAKKIEFKKEPESK